MYIRMCYCTIPEIVLATYIGLESPGTQSLVPRSMFILTDQVYIFTYYMHMYIRICRYNIYVCVFYTDSVLNITLQPSSFGQNIVGQRQNVICSISLPADVDPDTVKLGWLNEDDIITDDSRVTINMSRDYFNNSTLVTIIQFDPLAEEDKDEYTCYAIINGSFIIEFIYLQNFTSKY